MGEYTVAGGIAFPQTRQKLANFPKLLKTIPRNQDACARMRVILVAMNNMNLDEAQFGYSVDSRTPSCETLYVGVWLDWFVRLN